MLSEAILRKTKGFTQQKSLQHAAVLFSGKAGGQLIALLSQPVLARLYSPAQFGEFAFLNSLLAILLVAASGRFEAGMVLTRRPQHAKRLFQLSQLVLAAYIALLCLCLILIPQRLQQWLLGQGLSSAYFWFIPLLVLCAAYWELVHNWLVRFQRYSRISLALIIQRLLIFGGAVAAAVFAVPGNGLIYGLLTGSLGMLIFSLFSQKEPVRLNFRLIKSYSTRFSEFPRFSVPAVFLILFVQHLPVLLLTHFFGNKITGAYSMAFALLMLPLSLLLGSAGQVYEQQIAQCKAEEQGRIIRKYLLSFTGILAPFSLFVFLWGEPLSVWLLGDNWRMAGQIASLLAPLSLFLGVSHCLTIPLATFRKQQVFLFLQLFHLLLVALTFGTAYFHQDIFLSFKLLNGAALLHSVAAAGSMYAILKAKRSGRPSL